MNFLLTATIILGFYILANVFVLAPFMLSARISRWEENKK